jgi:hypothetical protein
MASTVSVFYFSENDRNVGVNQTTTAVESYTASNFTNSVSFGEMNSMMSATQVLLTIIGFVGSMVKVSYRLYGQRIFRIRAVCFQGLTDEHDQRLYR